MTERPYKIFKTPPFVGSYPNLWKPSTKFKTDNPKLGLQAIWTPKGFTEAEKTLWLALNAEIMEAVKDRFKITGANRKEVDDKLREIGGKPGIRDGKVREGKAGYGPGTWFASLNSNSMPGVIDLKGNPISPADDNTNLIFPGVILRATVTVFTFDKNGGKGYALGLNNLQKIKDGPRLDNRTEAKADFETDIEYEAQADGDVDDPEIKPKAKEYDEAEAY